MSSAPEYSFPVRLDTIGEEPRLLDLQADVGERAALAARFGLVAIEQLGASVALRRQGERIRCDGQLGARVIQSCVVTDQPVPAEIDEPFAILFEPARETPDQDEIELGADDLDTVAFTGAAIDVGEAIAQTLALALDPFPRAADADEALRAAGVVTEEEAGPFAALKALKNRA